MTKSTTAAQPLDLDKQRELFEAHFGPKDTFAWRTADDKYKVPSLQSAWEIWQAALIAQARTARLEDAAAAILSGEKWSKGNDSQGNEDLDEMACAGINIDTEDFPHQNAVEFYAQTLSEAQARRDAVLAAIQRTARLDTTASAQVAECLHCGKGVPEIDNCVDARFCNIAMVPERATKPVQAGEAVDTILAEFDRLSKILKVPGYCAGTRYSRREALAMALASFAPVSAQQGAAKAPAAQADEILSLHRQLAAEKLRADQGWERAEAKSRECIELRERFAASPASTPEASQQAAAENPGHKDCYCGGWTDDTGEYHNLECPELGQAAAVLASAQPKG